jgi:hypothetical protein
VNWSGSMIGSRLLLFVLLGAIGGFAGPRPAQAMGCHAPERPVLGLSFSGDRERRPTPEPLTIAAERTDSRAFVPVPCSGDVPGSTPVMALPLVALTSAPLVFGRSLACRFVREEPGCSPSFPFVSRLDRPPRLVPPAV